MKVRLGIEAGNSNAIRSYERPSLCEVQDEDEICGSFAPINDLPALHVFQGEKCGLRDSAPEFEEAQSS